MPPPSPPPPGVLLLAGVVPEGAGRGELAELVPDHGLGDVDGHVLATVMDGDGVADHVGDHRGATRPGLHHSLLALGVEVVDLLEKVIVDKGALLQRTRHCMLPPLAAGSAATNDELAARLVLLAGPALWLPPGRHRVAATGALALAAAERMVDRVHGHAAGLGADALPAVAARLADLDQVSLGEADLANGGPAVDRHPAHLGGGQAQGGEVALLGHELDAGTGRARNLPAAARLELDVVDGGADRDVAQREGIARADLGVAAALEQVAHPHVVGGE